MMFLKLTDTERSKEVIIPVEFARSIGVFKDMMDAATIERKDAVSKALLNLANTYCVGST
jgi:hypothetical protein